LILAVFNLHGAEYKAAEMTPPRSVDDVDSTLSNVSNQIRFHRGPVRLLSACGQELAWDSDKPGKNSALDTQIW
jgi:hypothetical protein